MKTLGKFGDGLLIGFGIATAIVISSVVYATYSTLTVSTGDTLSKDKWNELVSYTVPPGGVMAFYGTSCPSGWSAADGTINGVKKTDGSSGTLDLRGQFIRGLNSSSSGVDPSRTLGSQQNATRVFMSNSTNIGYGGGLWDQDQKIAADYDGSIESVSGGAYSAATSGSSISSWAVYGIRVRPANVALLYCVKN